MVLHMKYAIIKLGGRQFMVQEGDTFSLERQDENVKPEILLFSDDGDVKTGAELKDIKVELESVEEKRGRKIRIGKFLAKSTYRKVIGHRQPLSVMKVEKLGVKGSTDEKAVEEPKAKVAKETKAVKKSENAEKPSTKKATATKSSKKLSK